VSDEPLRQIGGRHRKVDAMERMRGVARYTDDLSLPNLLHARLVRCPHAHARIVRVDLGPALALCGVRAAITGRDLPAPYGIIPWTPDETALAVDEALFVGDPVACVAADDERTAAEACRLVRVEYEPLPPLFDPEQALASATRVNPRSKSGNVSKHVELAFGDVDGELGRAHLVVEGEYEFHGTTHAAIEPHCALAHVEPGGLLTVWSTTQVPHYLHRELGRVLGLPARRIRVIQPPIGGAFGGKSEPFALEFCVAKLALITGRPVKCLYTRE
jgi:CO/xanthine dehydrogenase Mo-binding subunit